MSTTLPLFWHLSSASKKERIDASVKLVSALEHFQAQFTPKGHTESASEEDEEEDVAESTGDGLDALNAQDVSYSIRRLVRGLASPRESSRQGFAVALTELLARITTVTCSQIVTLILDSTKTQGSMTGQEERDVLFARLFGLTAVIQSGLLVRDTPLSTSASSQTAASNAPNYQEVLTQLVELGEKKSWLRESAWWTIGLAIDALSTSQVAWRKEAFDASIHSILVDMKAWSPEKIALTLKLQQYCPERDWTKLLSPTFKQSHIVHTSNYTALARILKDLQVDEDDDAEGLKTKAGTWKPQVHFVWDMLLDEVLSEDQSQSEKSFPEFFRVLVDESLFSAASSNERKYWGFQIFQKALPRVNAADLPMLFTKNFMRSWINHLSNSDRYLHKIAKQVVADLQNIVKNNPNVGFTLLLQLTGAHGSHQFDKLTKTKTVETILTNMNNDGIQSYIEYLLKQVNDEQDAKTAEVQALNARRAWIVDQLAALVRNGAIPKDDQWIQTILDWFVVHGLFSIKKRSEKSKFVALHEAPNPVFSESLRKACRERLLSSLGDLTGHTTVIKTDDKTAKVAAVASDGQFWISTVLSTIDDLEKDTKHVTPLSEVDEEEQALRQKARELIVRLKKITGGQQDAAKGAELLLSATLLHQYCVDDGEEDDTDALESCIDGASRMFPAADGKKSKKSRKSAGAVDAAEAPEPVDVLVDTVIGFLEKATAYMRAVANQVFTLLAGSVGESTIDLILAQLERRNPDQLLEDEDDEMEEDSEGDDDDDDDEAGSSSGTDEEEEDEDEEDLDEDADPELRRKIEEALAVNGIHAATGSDDESEEEFMDDDQMMAIDAQLAAVFKARADEKKFGKGVDAQREATHYKNRVLDLVDTFLKKQPTSPFIVRLILPLIELIVGTGPDEKHLADKSTGILRSRIGKSKDVPSEVDVEQATEVLKEIHLRARKAASGDVLATLSQCSLYMSKCLLHAKEEDAVRDAYRESLIDFATRKASRLNSNFLQDFVRRHAETAWGFRNHLLEVIKQAVNGYRQVQVFQLIQTLFAQRPTTNIIVEEVVEFTQALCKAMQECIRNACEDEKLTAAQVKELLKLALAGVRHTKRVSSENIDTIRSTWDPASWDKLATTLASAERFKASMGLQTMCKQVSQLASKVASESVKSKKRKVESVDTEEAEPVEVTKKPKRRKQKASKSS